MSDDRCPTCGFYEPVEELERCLAALRGCIPWVASNKRGQAQEALAIACRIVGTDPYDWSSEPEVLARRIELLEEEGE